MISRYHNIGTILPFENKSFVVLDSQFRVPSCISNIPHNMKNAEIPHLHPHYNYKFDYLDICNQLPTDINSGTYNTNQIISSIEQSSEYKNYNAIGNFISSLSANIEDNPCIPNIQELIHIFNNIDIIDKTDPNPSNNMSLKHMFKEFGSCWSSTLYVRNYFWCLQYDGFLYCDNCAHGFGMIPIIELDN